MTDIDLAYLAGALRDGSVFYYRAGRNYTCVWYEQSEDYLRRSIVPRARRCFGRDAKILQYKPGHHRARIYCQEAHDCFIHRFGYKSPQMGWGTPRPVREGNEEVIAAYVAGFFDAEGDVSKTDSTIGFSQKNRESLRFIRRWLQRHGLSPSHIFVADKKSDTLRFYLTSRKQLAKFRELVPFEHPDKIVVIERLLQHT